MRKLLIPLVLSLFLISPPLAQAKSGCCSSHDGVNCGAGAQGNGKVICNDGSRGSSCLYSEMVMCGGASAPAAVMANPVQVPPPTQKILGETTTKPLQTPPKVIEKKKPKLSAEELKKERCEKDLKTIQTKITTQEKKKEKNLTQLFTSLDKLEEKVTALEESGKSTEQLIAKIEKISEDTASYQQAFDTYTNKLYEVSHNVCSDDVMTNTVLQKDEVVLAKPLAGMYLKIMKQVSQAK